MTRLSKSKTQNSLSCSSTKYMWECGLLLLSHTWVVRASSISIFSSFLFTVYSSGACFFYKWARWFTGLCHIAPVILPGVDISREYIFWSLENVDTRSEQSTRRAFFLHFVFVCESTVSSPVSTSYEISFLLKKRLVTGLHYVCYRCLLLLYVVLYRPLGLQVISRSLLSLFHPCTWCHSFSQTLYFLSGVPVCQNTHVSHFEWFACVTHHVTLCMHSFPVSCLMPLNFSLERSDWSDSKG